MCLTLCRLCRLQWPSVIALDCLRLSICLITIEMCSWWTSFAAAIGLSHLLAIFSTFLVFFISSLFPIVHPKVVVHSVWLLFIDEVSPFSGEVAKRLISRVILAIWTHKSQSRPFARKAFIQLASNRFTSDIKKCHWRCRCESQEGDKRVG